MLFTEELRKCLDEAGLSDCGENDAWNYWYQRVLKAHNEAVERQIATEQAENAKLRELVRRLISHVEHPPCEGCGFEMNCDGEHVTQCDEWLFMIADARKLGVEV